MSIRVPFTGVAALCSILVGSSKLLMPEMSTVSVVVMFVSAEASLYLCQWRSCLSVGYLLVSRNRNDVLKNEAYLQLQEIASSCKR
jgi:hypothetical protein